jgi:hypothetical protein
LVNDRRDENENRVLCFGVVDSLVGKVRGVRPYGMEQYFSPRLGSSTQPTSIFAAVFRHRTGRIAVMHERDVEKEIEDLKERVKQLEEQVEKLTQPEKD